MSKELRELLNQLDEKNTNLAKLLNKEGVTAEELTNASNDIDVLQAKIQAQKVKDKVDGDFTKGKEVEPESNKEVNYDGKLFTKAIADNLLKQKNLTGIALTDRERNVISENIGEDGGYAVPKDIQTKINERLKDKTDIFNLVDSEIVRTREGSRNYEKRSGKKPMKPLSENATIPSNGDSPKIEKIEWKLKDLADFMSLPNDLLKLADKSLEDWIINWFVDKVRITRNSQILYGAGDSENAKGLMKIAEFKKVKLTDKAGIKEFKKCRNVELLNVFKKTACWLVNQDGFNFLDSIEDKNGRPYLQPDPKNDSEYKFLGAKVIEVPNDVLETDDTDGIPILLGDLKEAYKYFSDGAYELATTNIGAGAFETNTTKARIIMRMDGTAKDTDALIKIYIPATVIEQPGA